MYRVAVIQNESEMQRTGYANVIAKFRNIHRFKDNYSFELYTVVNILDLFEKGYTHLSKYDSLIITTNATSDKVVYKILVSNRDSITQFIEKGKGIFIASQKKLSNIIDSQTEENIKNSHKALTHFLPEKYDFYTVRRPKNDSKDDDSGIGKISFSLTNEILLNYPEKVDEKKTNEKCERNAFQKHFYRSYLKPLEEVTYKPILIDDGKSYQNKFQRNLLLVNAYPEFGEKIIASSIVIDWEYHKELLINVITYITEGLPQIAFIDKEQNSNIKCLIESAKILKKAYTKYDNLNSLDVLGKQIHNIYVFSNDYKEQEIDDFFKTIDDNTGYISKRVYWIKEDNDILKLMRCSIYTSIDKIIGKSVPWLESLSPLEGGMWNNSFWTTFEILTLFEKLSDKLGLDVDKYIDPICNDIKSHYDPEKHSYDGVVSATCGLIQLLYLVKEKEYKQAAFTDDDFKGMIEWVANKDKFSVQSVFDKRNVVLTIGKINKIANYVSKEQYSRMIDDAMKSEIGNEDYSEIEICQIISLCLLSQDRNGDKIKSLLAAIKSKQTPIGTWSNLKHGNDNIGRTAHVLIFLLKNFDKLNTDKYISKSDLEDMIYQGVLFLRSKYNGKNWGDEDVQATAKATHAIFLYNERNHTSMFDYDVLKIIDDENYEITYSTVINELTNNLKNYRTLYNSLDKEKKVIQNENTKLIEHKNIFSRKQKTSATIIYILIIIVAILVVCLAKEIIDASVWQSIIAGFITAIILGLANFAAQKFNEISKLKQ